jgi:peptidoglycan/LPS O-acetylase OafA/YrhL
LKEVRALTGIRGVAALTVFLDHTRKTLAVWGLVYRGWSAQGVDSGSYLKYLRRRVARIFPLHAFMLALIVGFVHVMNRANGLGAPAPG